MMFGLKRNNENSMIGVCFVCNQSIKYCDFHVGHIESVAHGGTNSIHNLEPICSGCNLSMGKENLNY